MVDPPALPAAFLRTGTVAAVGSALWAIGAIALLITSWVTGRPLDIWFATCVTGTALGALGYGIYLWQRSAARRGSRTAQDGLT